MLTAIYTFLKMVAGFVVGKVVAIYTGPAGLAMLGQIQSLMTIITGITAAPVSTGLVRYTAETWPEGEQACVPWWRACAKISAVLFLTIVPLTILFSTQLSLLLFETQKYGWLIIFASCVLPCSIVNTMIASVLNGQQHFKKFIFLGMLSVIISTAIMSLLVIYFGINGALIATALNGAIAGIVLFLSCIKQPWLRFRFWFGKTEPYHMKAIGKYTLMALTTAATGPVSLICVRNILVDQTNWSDAGHWQAVWKISEVYLSVVTIALATYFLPKLAILKDSILIKREINTTLPYVMGITVCMALVIYLLRDFSITLLFTEEFRTARELFGMQLIGDVIKIAGFMYAYPLQAQGHTKLFISTEILFSLLFVASCYVLVGIYGVHGANLAYTFTYTAYFIFAFIFTNFVNVKSRKNEGAL